MIVLISVPHTGTRFVRDEILPQLTDNPGRDCHIQHVNPPAMNGLSHLCSYAWNRVIVPLRRPKAVALSWKRREEPVCELPGYWERLFELTRLCTPFYVPLDHPERDRFLEGIAAAWDRDVTTDWPYRSDSGGVALHRAVRVPDDYDHDRLTPSEEREFVTRPWERFRHFFGEVYG